jgi:hypothetical protein
MKDWTSVASGDLPKVNISLSWDGRYSVYRYSNDLFLCVQNMKTSAVSVLVGVGIWENDDFIGWDYNTEYPGDDWVVTHWLEIELPEGVTK